MRVGLRALDMLVLGVPDSELEWLHWNVGRGRGSLGLRHIPSGITVSGECFPDVPVSQIMQGLAAELHQKLRSTGLIAEHS